MVVVVVVVLAVEEEAGLSTGSLKTEAVASVLVVAAAFAMSSETSSRGAVAALAKPAVASSLTTGASSEAETEADADTVVAVVEVTAALVGIAVEFANTTVAFDGAVGESFEAAPPSRTVLSATGAFTAAGSGVEVEDAVMVWLDVRAEPGVWS